MLVIRQQQIDALIKGTDEEFVEFLANHAREEFPEKTAERDDETLREMARGGIRRAESHGFATAEDITAFFSVMMEIAPNFDEQPAIRAVLDDEQFEPAMRLERLWSPLVPEAAWEEAEKNYNENAWFAGKQ
ncbi:MAG: hypothetical protein JSS81_09455 [Acidobacteria bacterium]|nr:hypothetical protein [Acidobacteriota bacterium]